MNMNSIKSSTQTPFIYSAYNLESYNSSNMRSYAQLENSKQLNKRMKESRRQTFEPVLETVLEPVLEPVLVPVRAYGGVPLVPVPIPTPEYALGKIQVPEYTPPVQVPILKPEYALRQIP